MKIQLHEILVRDLVKNYKNNGEDGGVFGYDGKLNIRPKYQREFVYKDDKRDEVIRTVRNNFPLNTIYWSVNVDGTFEVLDGQQRIISICDYVMNEFSIKMHKSDEYNKNFSNLTDEEKEQILNYRLMVYFCEGTEREKLDWFQVINIAGEVLTPQELRNAIYTGTWLADAKKYFSKSDCMAKKIAENYIKGSPIRQEYLEKILEWKSGGVEKITEYMAEHQNDNDATELKNYFEEIFGNEFDDKIGWVGKIFTKYRKEMKGLEWGEFYNKYKNKELNPDEIEIQISEMMKNEEIQNKKWIYEYILTGNEKYLNVRTFSESQKTTMYERQGGLCAKKNCPEKTKIFKIYEMDADHIKPWTEGGKTEIENGQMLCRKCNQQKSSRF